VSDEAEATETQLPAGAVAAMRDAGEIELIDVRMDYEWDAGHLAGARHVEVNELTATAGSVQRDRAIVFYCRGGNRSGMAAHAFRAAGWDAYNMAGGISAWAEAGLPLEPVDGTVAEGRPPEA
jgi:rhodanese-related sulfurtransferase